MREGFAGFLSVVAAAAAPAAAFAIFIYATQSYEPARIATAAFFMAFIVAFGHALILGLPVALVLVHKGAFRTVPMLLAGACVGLLPAALTFPVSRVWLGKLLSNSCGSRSAWLPGWCCVLVHSPIISPNNSYTPNPLRGSA